MFSVASRSTVDRAELAREVSSIATENQLTDAFRRCPRCGAEEFEQRPWRGQRAADDGARPGG
jgi:hypothetical protein